MGNAGSLEDAACLGHRCLTQPAGHQAARHLLRQRHQRTRNLGAGDDGRGGVDEQHGSGRRVIVQGLQRLHITLHRRVADDVDRVGARPGGRQQGVQLGQRGRAQRGQCDTGVRCRIGRQHTGTPAVGQDRQRVRLIGGKPGQGLGGQKQLLHRVDPQHAAACYRRVVHQVRAGQRAGV